MPREQQTSEKVAGNITKMMLCTEEGYVIPLYTAYLKTILF